MQSVPVSSRGVEDDAETRQMLRRILESEGWEVSEATNGRVGVERMNAEPADIVLLDLMMPEMDGFEFLEFLRQDGRWRTVPVVIVTAKELTAEDRVRLSGAVGKVLHKGAYGKEDLLRELGKLLEPYARRSNEVSARELRADNSEGHFRIDHTAR